MRMMPSKKLPFKINATFLDEMWWHNSNSNSNSNSSIITVTFTLIHHWLTIWRVPVWQLVVMCKIMEDRHWELNVVERAITITMSEIMTIHWYCHMDTGHWIHDLVSPPRHVPPRKPVDFINKAWFVPRHKSFKIVWDWYVVPGVTVGVWEFVKIHAHLAAAAHLLLLLAPIISICDCSHGHPASYHQTLCWSCRYGWQSRNSVSFQNYACCCWKRTRYQVLCWLARTN